MNVQNPKNKPYIGIVPHKYRKTSNLGNILLSELESNASHIPKNKTINDLSREDHIIISPSSRVWFFY